MTPRMNAPFTYFSTPDYPSNGEDNGPPPLDTVAPVKPDNIVGQRHVRLNHIAASRTNRSRNIYLPSTASPLAPLVPHVPHRSDHESNWSMEPPPPVNNFYELYPFADPSYQHAMDIMDPEVIPRKRTKSVSYSVWFVLLPPTHNLDYRIIPCSTG